MSSRDSNANKRWVVFVGLGLLALALAVGLWPRERLGGGDGRDGGKRSPAGPTPPTRVDFPVNQGGSAGGGVDARPAVEPPPVEKQIETIMGTWRNAILVRDADAVVAADGAFQHEPQKFLQALMTSAETDSDDRVRAFSTRVLGKLKNPACAPVLQRLLGDRSQYVRMNAAWGLGELATTPEGRAVAKRALHALRRLEKTETAKDTRDAASLAARRLM
jgi:HEAT repeats